jgi:hypothetical protein
LGPTIIDLNIKLTSEQIEQERSRWHTSCRGDSFGNVSDNSNRKLIRKKNGNTLRFLTPKEAVHMRCRGHVVDTLSALTAEVQHEAPEILKPSITCECASNFSADLSHHELNQPGAFSNTTQKEEFLSVCSFDGKDGKKFHHPFLLRVCM